MQLTDRKLKILQAIITDYVRTAEPVGSRTLSRHPELDLSPATIRNEMADLTDMGYLMQPHTSAGRVPTEKAYRLYVDGMMEKRELSERAKHEINSRLYDEVSEFEQAIEHATKLLSEITNLTSFALAPSKEEEILKYVNLIPVSEQTAIMMIVTESGKVTTKNIKMSAPYTIEALAFLAKTMTYSYMGKTVSEALMNNIIASSDADVVALSGLAGDVMPAFKRALHEMLSVGLYMDGITSIFDIPEFSDVERARRFIDMAVKKEELTREMIERKDGLQVTIGRENEDEVLSSCSVVTKTYCIDGKPVGKIGVIGPTRMRYDEVTSLMEYLANQIEGGE